MDDVNLFSALMGKNILDANSDEETAEAIQVMMNMTLAELCDFVKEKLPKSLLKMKVSTLADLALNMDPAELDSFNFEDMKP